MEYIVNPGEISALESLECILKSCGDYPITRFKMGYKELLDIEPAFKEKKFDISLSVDTTSILGSIKPQKKSKKKQPANSNKNTEKKSKPKLSKDEHKTIEHDE